MCHWSFHPYLLLSIILFHVGISCCLLPKNKLWDEPRKVHHKEKKNRKTRKKSSRSETWSEKAWPSQDQRHKVEKFPVLSSLIAEVIVTHVFQQHIKSNLINWSTWSMLQKDFPSTEVELHTVHLFIWIMQVIFVLMIQVAKAFCIMALFSLCQRV